MFKATNATEKFLGEQTLLTIPILVRINFSPTRADPNTTVKPVLCPVAERHVPLKIERYLSMRCQLAWFDPAGCEALLHVKMELGDGIQNLIFERAPNMWRQSRYPGYHLRPITDHLLTRLPFSVNAVWTDKINPVAQTRRHKAQENSFESAVQPPLTLKTLLCRSLRLGHGRRLTSPSRSRRSRDTAGDVARPFSRFCTA